MKRFLVSVFLLGIAVCSFSATKTWIGISGSNWNNAANWSPAGGAPVAGDDIVINTNGTIIIDFASTFIALNSITVANNSIVVFDCASTKNFRLSSASSITPGLLVNAGSSLTLNGSNAGTNNSAFDLTYGTGVVGSIYGTLIFSKTGGSPSNPSVQLITDNNSTNYGIVTVYSGGIIRVNPDAGNTSSSLIPVSTIIMKNGSIYENLKNGGSLPEGTWEPNSLVKNNNLIGTSTPTFNGTSYGNLEWDMPNQNNFSLSMDITFNNINLVNTKNGASAFRITNSANATYTLTINGNLTISNNSKLEITGSGVMTGGGRLILKGNLNNQGTITTTGGAGTTNDFELNGTSNQNISTTGTISGAKTPTIPGLTFIMNSAGATLNSPLTLPANLTLLEGNIKTTSTNILTMIRNASYSTDLNHGYIEGPMKKIGDEDFTFPVGIGSIYAPITFNNEVGSPTSTTDVFEAEYVRANPQSFVGDNYGPSAGINHVSYIEYWRLQETSGAGARSKNIALTVNAGSFCRVINSTFISRYSGSGWTNEGGIVLGIPGSAGIYQTGTLRAANNVSSFGYFTLATALDFTLNPLPIKLISFNATKISERKAVLDWELAECCSSSAKFEIERAGDSRRFVGIATVGGNETNRFYSILDNDLKTGVNYYRLKMTDADGAVTYSRIVAVLNGVKGLLITMSPTIVTNNVSLTVSSASEQRLDLLVADMLGKTVRKISQKVAAGNTSIPLSLEGLQSGTYQLFGVTGEGKTNLIRFIKK